MALVHQEILCSERTRRPLLIHLWVIQMRFKGQQDILSCWCVAVLWHVTVLFKCTFFNWFFIYSIKCNCSCRSSQVWDVYSVLPAELWFPASGCSLPDRQHRLQRGGQRQSRPGLPERAEGDVEAAHQPAVWRSGHAHTRLLPIPGPHPERGGVPEDGLQLEDEGGAGQLHA